MIGNIFIWGTGIVAQDFLKKVNIEKIYGFIETIPSKCSFQGKKVFLPKEIVMRENDIIVVATANPKEIEEIVNSEDNIIDHRVLYLRNTNLKDKFLNVVKWKLLKEIMSEYEFEKFLRKNSVDSLLYNAMFIRTLCDYWGYVFPEKFETADGVMNYNLQGEEIYRPTISSIWDGKW